MQGAGLAEGRHLCMLKQVLEEEMRELRHQKQLVCSPAQAFDAGVVEEVQRRNEELSDENAYLKQSFNEVITYALHCCTKALRQGATGRRCCEEEARVSGVGCGVSGGGEGVGCRVFKVEAKV